MYEMKKVKDIEEKSQCRHFVQRKKRFCRMTVRPGKNYCGEHEPEPQTNSGELDVRVPCPLDPKHTCYASKLEKHVTICNAKQDTVPDYIVHNINAPSETFTSHRKPLSQTTKEDLQLCIDKINDLYERHIKGNIETLPPRDIHLAVLPEFNEDYRTESSRRHLRQASRLLHLVEEEGLVQDNTCYVELGAGKGHLSYYVCGAWCTPGTAGTGEGQGAGTGSCALLIDRAALRHKRDNKLKERSVVHRVRADLAHMNLRLVGCVSERRRCIALAKHLCGVAADYALRCVSEVAEGVVMATCCHHRCEEDTFVDKQQLRALGISSEEFNIMLGVVSWATCGDGRSRKERERERGKQQDLPPPDSHQITTAQDATEHPVETDGLEEKTKYTLNKGDEVNDSTLNAKVTSGSKDQSEREEVGRRAKALIDWARVLYLKDKGFDARLCYFVPTNISLENVCIVAKKSSVTK